MGSPTRELPGADALRPAQQSGSSDAVARGVWGAAEIGFVRRGDATRLSHLYERDPLRVLFPQPEAGEPPQAVIVTTSGGLVAGDRIDVAVMVDSNAAAHVTASAAEKIYRSLGATTEISQSLCVGAGASLEFLPPDTILFDGARLRRQTTLDLATSAAFLGGEIVVFGRRAHGERFSRGFLHQVWEVRRDGELIWGDALHLDGDIAAIIDNPACFDGAAAFATMILAPATADPKQFLGCTRAVQASAASPDLKAGVTVVGGVLVARWLAREAMSLRRAYADLACHLRSAAMGLPRHMPRVWHV
jgi:urease accessory protein